MLVNPFDNAVRYAAKLDPPAFLAWALDLSPDALAFGGWLDTRAVPLPKEPDQIGDTVARLSNPRATEPDWAVSVEFQTEPDALMFGRLLVYMGNLWQVEKPDPERGSRYQVGAVVFNLTGTGTASRLAVGRRPAALSGTGGRKATEQTLARYAPRHPLGGGGTQPGVRTCR